jgi:predicted DNA-binding transcriptional regulator AlpA
LTHKQYITPKKIQKRFGDISTMTLWRWEHDESLGFPKPTIINRRNYYDLAEIEAWEQSRCREFVVHRSTSDLGE